MSNPDPGPIPALPIEYASAPLDHTHAKWRTWSIVLGIIPIVVGSLSGLLGLLVPLALLAPRPPGMPRQTPFAPLGGMALYLGMGGLLVWLGIGAVTMRRWVRPIALTTATIVLVSGILATVSIALFYPSLRTAMAARPAAAGVAPLPPGFYTIVMTVMLLFMIVLFVIIPGAFVWFYRKQEVKAALEFYDSKPRWTDACPIPVLGMAVGLALYGASALFASMQGMAPVLGTVLRGPAAVAVMAAFAGVAFVLARLVYRIKMSGWWGTLALVIVLVIAYGATAIRSNQVELYRAAGFSDEQLQLMAGFWQTAITLKLAMSLPWLILIVGYLLYVRKYFTMDKAAQESSA